MTNMDWTGGFTSACPECGVSIRYEHGRRVDDGACKHDGPAALPAAVIRCMMQQRDAVGVCAWLVSWLAVDADERRGMEDDVLLAHAHGTTPQ